MWFKYKGHWLKDKYSFPTSVLLFSDAMLLQYVQASLLQPKCYGSPLFYTVRPLLVVYINAPSGLTHVTIAMFLLLGFSCKVPGFSTGHLQASSLCDCFITACRLTDDGSYWVCGCVYEEVGSITGINVTMAER